MKTAIYNVDVESLPLDRDYWSIFRMEFNVRHNYAYLEIGRYDDFDINN